MKIRFKLTIACISILLSLQCISCDEHPQGPGLNKWICSCASANRGNATYSIAANCSTLCDWNPGSAGEPKVMSKRITSKVVVYVLLLSVVLTTLAFLASLGCYVYRRDIYPTQPPIFSSDKDTSCNSATNLIRHASTSTSSVSTFKLNTSSSVNPLTGN
ncbi:hypothetical protein MKX01_040399 [Papaver californicum]|nr:hypothetical protein MKX01_040399 [Papaver californicum]